MGGKSEKFVFRFTIRFVIQKRKLLYAVGGSPIIVDLPSIKILGLNTGELLRWRIIFYSAQLGFVNIFSITEGKDCCAVWIHPDSASQELNVCFGFSESGNDCASVCIYVHKIIT